MDFRIHLVVASRLLTGSPNRLIRMHMVGINITNSKEQGKRKKNSSQMRPGIILAMRIT